MSIDNCKIILLENFEAKDSSFECLKSDYAMRETNITKQPQENTK